MKHLYLMRHAHPVNGHPMDGARPLDDKGIKQAKDMGEWMRKEVGRVDIVLCSPFARGMQTAKIMAEALGSHVADSKMIQPDGTPSDMWKEIERLAQQSDEVLVVGHDPSINAFLLWLVGGHDASTPPEVRFEHGAIAKIKLGSRPGFAGGTLRWLVDPKLVIKEEDKELEEAAVQLAEALQNPVELYPGDSMTVKMRMVSELEDGGLLMQLESV